MRHAFLNVKKIALQLAYVHPLLVRCLSVCDLIFPYYVDPPQPPPPSAAPPDVGNIDNNDHPTLDCVNSVKDNIVSAGNYTINEKLR